MTVGLIKNRRRLLNISCAIGTGVRPRPHPTTGMRSVAPVAALTAVLSGAQIPLALAQGDVAAGKRIYQERCVGCHGDEQRGATVGPSLVGIVGRKAGTQVDAPTSRALLESGMTWDEASLRSYLSSPSDTVHGTIMPVGVQNPRERDDLVAYLKSLR